MIDTKRKEELSISYLNALCAYVGISLERQQHDDDSIDVMIKKSMIRVDDCRYDAQLAIQLKCTSMELTEDDDCISFPLKMKNYDDLRAKSTTQKILVVLVLPCEEGRWICHSINELIIRRCMYWINLANHPDSTNKENITIKLNKSDYITSEKLLELLRKIAEEEEI